MKQTKNLVLSALFIAIGIILPFFTGQIPQIGSMLCPMHIPVILCGFICGWQYGLAVGFVTPLLRSVMFGMPPIMPTATAMAFELAVYGVVTAFLYRRLPKKNSYLYVSLIGAMLAGRVVWGLVSIVLYGMTGKSFTFRIFLSGAVLNAIPGIILQIVLIPVIMMALKKAGVLNAYAAEERN
ncbi:MAG: ECF transporter S component [Lachnospiraceae bacterium]|nr:ECF transporter S component [Lachnospiraceae bacterium]